jgi:uncharacterized membrane protein (DUF485 family)
MKVNTSASGVLIPSLLAGALYFVIAFSTGASMAASVTGGILVAAVAALIGFIFRAVYKMMRDDARSGPDA